MELGEKARRMNSNDRTVQRNPVNTEQRQRQFPATRSPAASAAAALLNATLFRGATWL